MMEQGQQAGKSLVTRWARWLLPWGALVLAPLLLLGPPVARGEVLFWGTPMLQFIPWRQFAWEAVLSGQLPLWNPLLGLGAPLLANHQAALLYPPNWLLPLLGIAWGHGPLVILHWIIAGVGMALLARQLHVGRLGQAVAGLAYALSGYLVARAGFFSINAATAWLPWVVLGTERLFSQPAEETGWKGWLHGSVGLALPLTMQWLAGHAQTAWYTLLLATAWWCFRVLQGGQSTVTVRRAVRFVSGGVLAFLLAAPQLLPTLEYLLQSQRAGTVDPATAMTYSFWPWRLLELLVPGAFGLPQSNLFWGYANYWEDAIYIGALPLLLAAGGAAAAVLRRTRRSQLTWFLGAVAIVSLSLALGENTPIFPWLFEHIPTFDLFRAPTRWNLLMVFSLALLSGLACEAWRPAEGRALYWLRLGTAGAGAVTGAAWLAALLLDQVRMSLVSAFALAGVWLFLAGVLALLQPRVPRPRWELAVVALVAVDLLLAHSGLNPTTGAELYRGRSSLADVVEGDERIYLASDAEYTLTFYESFRFDTFQAREDWRWVRQVGLPNATMLDGLHSADNFDPLLPARFVTWLETLEQLPGEQRAVWLRLMNVAAYADSLDGGSQPRYEPIAGGARARWIGAARGVADGEAALQALVEPGFDPDAQVILEGVASSEASVGSGRVLAVEDPAPDKVEVTYEAEAAGWVLLADTWYPGWTASVDGKQVSIRRANYLFRAVEVPAGRHTLHFRYRPLSFMLGWGGFGLGALLLLLFWRKQVTL